MTLRDELESLHLEHNGLKQKETQIKWQVSVQNALGVLIATTVIGLSGFMYHWHQSSGEVRDELMVEIHGIKEWQQKHSAFAEYGTKDVAKLIERVDKIEGFMNQGRRFTFEDGKEHEKRLAALESKFEVINVSLNEIIRRLDLVHRGTKQGMP